MSTFSGSYSPQDVEILLDLADCEPVSVAEKEALIQSGRGHYSDVVVKEAPPSDIGRRLFRDLCRRNGPRLAACIRRLTHNVAQDYPSGVVLVSLARAGIPIGILLRRSLVRQGVSVRHFAISVIRDRGVDRRALGRVRDIADGVPVLFVDGWTGKGGIWRELRMSLESHPDDAEFIGTPRLAVALDLAGVADYSGTGRDFLVPSAAHGAVVSGLVSRSLFDGDHVRRGGFHQCVVHSELTPYDVSRWFVDYVDGLVALKPVGEGWPASRDGSGDMLELVDDVMAEAGCTDRHLIKPGYAEATRACLRRVPGLVFVRDPNDVDAHQLLWSCRRDQVPVRLRPSMPCGAVTVIRPLGRAHRRWRPS